MANTEKPRFYPITDIEDVLDAGAHDFSFIPEPVLERIKGAEHNILGSLPGASPGSGQIIFGLATIRVITMFPIISGEPLDSTLARLEDSLARMEKLSSNPPCPSEQIRKLIAREIKRSTPSI